MPMEGERRTPIDRMIDSATKCVRCGAPYGGCSCWEKIVLRCPKCGTKKRVLKEDTDPPGTAVVEYPCPRCEASGDRPEARYYDSKERWFDGEKFRERTP